LPKTVYDISLPIYPGMVVYPGDPDFSCAQLYSLSRGDGCNVSKLAMGSHSGTHIDAPSHYFTKGLTIDQILPAYFLGPARVLEISTTSRIELAHLLTKDIQEDQRILFKTANSQYLKEKKFNPDYIALSPQAARYLVQKKVKLVGIDYYSIDSSAACSTADSDNPCHLILLRAMIPILEGLDLSEVDEGEYELIALPLKIVGCDASPVRAVLIGR